MEGGILTDQDMGGAVVLPFGDGEVAVYSRKAPDKNGANQDGAAILPHGHAGGVLVVADGLGGHVGGASASRIAIECLRDAAAAGEEGHELRTAILDALEESNRRILALGIGAGTTVAAVQIDGRRLRPYHVGDSAILVVGQRGKMKLQTIAHSPVGYAVEAGVLDEAAALHHEERHLVSNIVGSPEMRIEVGSWLPLTQRDTVVLGTDGLFDNARLDEIVEMVRSGPIEDAVDLLAKHCTARMASACDGEPSKPDDLTFILYRPYRSPKAKRPTSRQHAYPPPGKDVPVQATPRSCRSASMPRSHG